MPDVSAILAVKDGAAYLREALDSMLGQSEPLFELIVVDDGSTDDTPAILASYGARVRVITQANAGQAAAIAAGSAIATGEFLAINDADDLWPLDRQSRLLAALAAGPELDAVFGMSEQFVSPELPDVDKERLQPRQAILVGEIAQAMLVRRAAFDRFGGYDPALRGAGFPNWLARAKAGGLRSRMLPDVVHRRRLHMTNYGRTHAGERDQNLLAALRRSIERRRTLT